MLDDLAGRRTGERIKVLRERRGLSWPTVPVRLVGVLGLYTWRRWRRAR